MYRREIQRILKEIPTDFECEPGCFDCCKVHSWSWVEWGPVQDKRSAASLSGPCPYVSAEGCSVYAQRPLICRLYGNSGHIGDFGDFKNVSLACPRGISPTTPLTQRDASRLFQRIVGVIRKEANDAMNQRACPLYAGPFGPLLRPKPGQIVLPELAGP
jgi:hypothetical protein